MENASKALLIVAAVLIAIVLVALGISLLSSASNTSDLAKQAGDTMSDKTKDMATSVTLALTDVSSMSEWEFSEYLRKKYTDYWNNSQWRYIGENRTGKEVLELCQLIKNRHGELHKSGWENSCYYFTEITCNNQDYTIHRGNIEKVVEPQKFYKVYFDQRNAAYGNNEKVYSIKVIEITEE